MKRLFIISILVIGATINAYASDVEVYKSDANLTAIQISGSAAADIVKAMSKKQYNYPTRAQAPVDNTPHIDGVRISCHKDEGEDVCHILFTPKGDVIKMSY